MPTDSISQLDAGAFRCVTNPAAVASAVARQIEPLLVSETVAAKMLGGISPRCLFEIRSRGEIPFIKIGTRVFYDPADLSAWRDRNKQRNVTPAMELVET